jgi:aromatic ring-opening dioxygenase catalytic subunit (LigB family)
MPLVYCGACSHAPGITSRAERADTQTRQALHQALYRMGDEIRATRPDALVVVAAEHFANFFMNNMPAFAMGMADSYEGPIEDGASVKIKRTRVPGNKALSKKLIEGVMQTVDVAYAEEWKFDHGISVPLHFLTPNYDLPIVPANINCQGPPLTPLSRAWAFGEALRAAADAVPERIALVATGGISHWPATPDSGKINEAWDREFLARWAANDRDALPLLHRRRNLPRRRPGWLRDPHLHRRRGGREGRQGPHRFLRTHPDLRRKLHRRANGARSLDFLPERHDKHVAMGRLRRVLRLDRRDTVVAAGIVDQCRVKRIGEGEAAERALVEIVHGGCAASDIAAGDQQHQHIVDAVAMHALRRGLALLAEAGLDAELVRLDMPMRHVGREAAEQRAAIFEDGAEARALGDLGLDRLEPALDAAVQHVVVEALIVRLMRPAHDRTPALGGEDREPPASIASTVSHVGVGREIVPALGEGRPVGERAEAAQRGAHVGRLDEGITGAGDRLADARRILQTCSDLAHGQKPSTGGSGPAI